MALTEFSPPAHESLRSRKTAVRSLFARALIPSIPPSDADYRTALQILRQRIGEPLDCSYCGDPATEWDHLRPVMRNGRPTGQLSIIQNLVPACSKCNQSKGNQDWHDWMHGSAPQSPATRHVRDRQRRSRRLARYETWGAGLHVDFASEAHADTLRAHFADLDRVLAILHRAETRAADVRNDLRSRLPDILPAPARPSLVARFCRWLLRR